MLECENGTITVVENPQLKHDPAVLGEGCITGIALSRKGLITAGKVVNFTGM